MTETENEARRGTFLKWVIKSNGDTIKSVADELGITRIALSYKINAYVFKDRFLYEFTQREMQYISNKYGFSDDEEMYAFIDDSAIRDEIDTSAKWVSSKKKSKSKEIIPTKKLKRVKMVATNTESGEEIPFERYVDAADYFLVEYGVIYNRLERKIKSDTLLDTNGKRWTIRHATEEDKLKYTDGATE